MRRNELRPAFTGRAAAAQRLFQRGRVNTGNDGTLKVVAYRNRQSVGRIEPFGQLLQFQHAFEDGGNLLLRCRPLPRNRLLDPARGILSHRAPLAQGGSHSHSLRPSQFQHTLYVIAEEGRFQRHFVRAVFIDQCTNPFENVV